MLDSLIKGFIFTPAYACVVYAVIFFTNWKKLRTSQRVFTIWLVAMVNYYLMTTCLLLGDIEAYSRLMLTDSFVAPFIILQSFLFIYSQLHTESLFQTKLRPLILIPILVLILALINFSANGYDSYYQVAAFMIDKDVPYPKINFLFSLITLLYDTTVVGGYVFVVIYTAIKIKWYEKEVQKYTADSYSKILPMRGQMTMFLFLMVASMGILPIIHFTSKEYLLSCCPLYYFLLTLLLVNTCRKIHHGYKHVKVEGQEMLEIDKEEAFYEDVFNKFVANSQKSELTKKESTEIITEDTTERNTVAENDDKQSGDKPKAQPSEPVTEQESETDGKANAESTTETNAENHIKENAEGEKTGQCLPSKNLIGYVSALDISESLKELMSTRKLYLQQDITIKDVASAIGTNSSYLSIYLNRVLDLSFSEYINKLRIEREVLPLLKADPDTPTKELILAGNFAHRTSFYRAFQKVTGEALMDYREKLLSNK